VYEWCWDWYQSDYYDTSSTTDPVGPASGSSGRVRRGGAALGSALGCRCAQRPGGHPHYTYGYVGFRLVRAVE